MSWRVLCGVGCLLCFTPFGSTDASAQENPGTEPATLPPSAASATETKPKPKPKAEDSTATASGSATGSATATEDPSKSGKEGEDKCAVACKGCEKDGVLTLRRVPQISVAENSNAGSARLELKNTGSGKLTGTLCAGDFASAFDKQPIEARVTFQKIEDATVPEGQAPKKNACYQLAIACGQHESVLVEAEGNWTADEARAPLLLDDKPLLFAEQPPAEKPAELSVRKLRVPFNVKLATPGTREAPLVVEGTDELSLVLQNDDGFEYSIEWSLLIDRAKVAPGDGGERTAAAPSAGKPAVVSKTGEPKDALPRLVPGANPFKITLPGELFPGPTGLLKSKLVEGTLLVRYVDMTNGPTTGPPRELPVVLSLGTCRKPVRAFWGFLFCLVLLLVGGVASLFLHQALPNRFRRLTIRMQLDWIATQTKRLSTHIPGALRVALRVQRLELSTRLGNEIAFFPGASETYEDVAQDGDVLARRIDLISQIDERLLLIERMGGSGPPDLLHAEKRRLEGALPALAAKKPEPASFAATRQLIVEVDAALTRIKNEDQGIRDALEKAALDYWKTRFSPEWGRLPTEPWATDLKKELDGFVKHAKRCFELQQASAATAGAGPMADETLTSIDTALAKMKLIVGYVRVCESATPAQVERFDECGDADDKRNPGQKPTQRQRFFDCLSGTGSRTLEQARLVLRQAEQGIFVKRLGEEIKLGKFRLTAEPQSVAPLDPVTFRYVFFEEKFNDAAAREKLSCVWTFTHKDPMGKEVGYEEDCWEAVQFFPAGGPQTVAVRVARGADLYLPEQSADPSAALSAQGDMKRLEQVVVHVRENPRTRFVYVRPWRWPERAKLEVMQLCVALLVTMGALLSGALDQIEKLDILAASAVIIGLGFGADVLKNIVARRPANSPAPAPPA